MKTRTLLVGALMSLFAVEALAQPPDPSLGTWKFNLAKSKINSGSPPKSWVDSYEAVGGDIKYTSTRVLSDGKPASFGWIAKADGKDYPYTGSASADSISMTRVDAYTTDWVLKKGGKVVQTGRTTYSRDGKLRTLTWKGLGVSTGQKTEGTAVFERQ
jgi:hypothetical protein